MLGGTLERKNKSGTVLVITLPLKDIPVKDLAAAGKEGSGN